jgi:hypothetical protein
MIDRTSAVIDTSGRISGRYAQKRNLNETGNHEVLEAEGHR